uniref:Uncharacterized protein n=1 Tax=Kalanchoe fedtschenkoi TaxID=63787 RepID=A0A7N0T450_KALFE
MAERGGVPIPVEKDGAIVTKGDAEGFKLARQLLEEFGLPLGLLPLAGVIEMGYVPSTGYIWVLQEKKRLHNFKLVNRLATYDVEIHGYIEKGRIKKLKGVKVKELTMWPPIFEVYVDDDDQAGMIHFKSLAGITKSFPVEAFALPLEAEEISTL